MDLGAMTWTDIHAPLLVVPVGSCEQHGPHLPLHTDSVIAEALAADLVARRDDCIVAPTLSITASGEHAGFPGTLSIGTEALATVVVELARSAEWASGVVFVNGHGGNTAALRHAEGVFDHERRRVLVWWPTIPGSDLHAGHTETSLMLALAPDQVRLDRAETGPTPTIDELVRQGVKPLSPTGVLGDPTGASAAHGADLFHQLAEQLGTAVADWVA